MQSHTKVLTKFNVSQVSKIFRYPIFVDIQFNDICIKNPYRKETRRRLRWILENPKCTYCNNIATFGKIESTLLKTKPVINCFVKDCLFCFYANKRIDYSPPNIQIYSQNDVLMTIDHIKPKSKGGARGVSNWQTCCVKCNTQKDSNENFTNDLTVKLEDFVSQQTETNKFYEFWNRKNCTKLFGSSQEKQF